MSEKTATLTDNKNPGDVPFVVVWEQDQFGDEEGVVEPDPKDDADAEPAHRIHHEVESKLHGCFP